MTDVTDVTDVADVADDGLELGWDAEHQVTIYFLSKEWIVAARPMIFNDRVFLARRETYEQGWVAAWCYDKNGLADIAARIFDPDVTDEPIGYKKVAFDAR